LGPASAALPIESILLFEVGFWMKIPALIMHFGTRMANGMRIYTRLLKVVCVLAA
jgi:hypothetical protein